MKNITAFGEILWDVYPDEKRLGGAPFNFIYHIWKILGRANFISSVGNDENGKEIFYYLNSMGFNTKNIIVDKEHPTGTVQVVLDDNKAPCFTPTYNCCYDFVKLDEQMRKMILQEAALIYFGTFSARSEITRETLFSLLNHPNKKYFCDLNLRHDLFTKNLIERALLSVNVLKINDAELFKLKELFNLLTSDNEACFFLLNKFDIDLIGLTLGERGAFLFNKNESDYYISESAQIIDTLGAGDAFAAILCLGYLQQLPLTQLNQLANEFALEICKVNGALPHDNSIYQKYQELFAVI
ncbi:MAG: fructokinase [Stygiobacter sp.]|nr:MAG: fructokinase [Stygiobacter sp.]KAF0217694.1 MAG: hypothetical protein FD178_506 [Ignavibacteria bacterium]